MNFDWSSLGPFNIESRIKGKILLNGPEMFTVIAFSIPSSNTDLILLSIDDIGF
jgi:hypothetical protein